MTNPSDAREAAAKAVHDSEGTIYSWESAFEIFRINARTRANAAIDAYRSSSTEDGGERNYKAVADKLADAPTLTKLIVLGDAFACRDLLQRAAVARDFLAHAADDNAALRSRVGELEKERDKFQAGWKEAFDIGIKHQNNLEALQSENATLQSDLEQMRKERDRELSALRERCAKEMFHVFTRVTEDRQLLYKPATRDEVIAAIRALPITPHTEED